MCKLSSVKYGPAASEDSRNLFPPQQDILTAGFRQTRENWLISAPTGSGKTLIGEWAMEDAIKDGFTAAYIAPLKAIVEEKTVAWRQKYNHLTIGLFTGDTLRAKPGKSPREEHILLFTPEKLNAYLQNWKRHLPWLSRLGVLVVDEFHFVGDDGRGSCLETLISRLRRVNPFIRFVGLSATIHNVKELAKWLNARSFESQWRPVPLERHVATFKKPAEKQDLLLTEVFRTIKDGGRILVFVNSRKRAESVARFLNEQGVKADFNHAGLSLERRTEAQKKMRYGGLDVLVATSTLEMGVNFPARKVIVYDAYTFDGDTFAPLSVQRYLQFSGRAGRAGLDATGESVLFLPNWAVGKIDYLNGQPEPVRSSLFSTTNLLREVLSEIAGRLSISELHLEVNFSRGTLWRRQGGKLDLKRHVAVLIDADLVRRAGTQKEYLSVTPLGRVAAQMGVSPGTIMLLADLNKNCTMPTTYDLLLACCLAEEASPHLGFNFEEIEHMSDTVLNVPSQLLDQPGATLSRMGGGFSGKRILSAIKCASILHLSCQGETIEALAGRFDTYSLDLDILRGNVSWVLETGLRTFAILRQRKSIESEKVDASSAHEDLCRDLARMLQYGIPSEALGLVEIEGIGPKRAQALVRHGLTTPEDLLEEDEESLGHILRMRPVTVKKMLESAEVVAQKESDRIGPFERDRFVWLGTRGEKRQVQNGWRSDLDPYRLRRALDLAVDCCSAETVRISGGTEPHTVKVATNPKGERRYTCDCVDFANGHPQCKHVLRARIALRDDGEIVTALQSLQEGQEHPLRFGLGDLWARVGSPFDRFNDLKMDAGGERLLQRLRQRGVGQR